MFENRISKCKKFLYANYEFNGIKFRIQVSDEIEKGIVFVFLSEEQIECIENNIGNMKLRTNLGRLAVYFMRKSKAGVSYKAFYKHYDLCEETYPNILYFQFVVFNGIETWDWHREKFINQDKAFLSLALHELEAEDLILQIVNTLNKNCETR